MKKYITPELRTYDMAPTNILQGSLKVKAKVGISSFRTDEDDWTTEESSDGTTKSKYNFWE
ncbi:MAG: hypothetical protein K6E86_04095 [Bacteroidales bacterium]|nr:hypothetical protein [Bacteroidales bacterium]